MTVLDVIPIGRGLSPDRLSYYTTQPVDPGTIVYVSIRRRLIPALVLSSSPAIDLKATLKQNSYPLKKITRIQTGRPFLPEFILAATAVSQFSLAPLGAILKASIPQVILDNLANPQAGDSPAKTNLANMAANQRPPANHQRLALQQPLDERLTYYRGLIREHLARKQSIWFILPTTHYVEYFARQLGRGIEERVFVIHHALNRRELVTRWTKALDETQSILLVTTATALALPRTDWSTLIIEAEGSAAYKNTRRPFLDSRRLAEKLAETSKKTVIIGDTVFRPETAWRLENKEIEPAVPIKKRLLSTAETLVVGYTAADEISRFLSPEFRSLVSALTPGEKMLVFTARRGLSPVIVCRDCGHLTLCRRCQNPIAFHRQPTDREATSSEPNLLICHRCHEERRVDRHCPHCQGWRLAASGVGITQIREEITRLFPATTLYQLDSDHATTKLQAERLKKKWLDTGGLLLGTELALNIVDEPVDYAAAVAIDSLLALPDFRLGDKIFRQLVNLRAKTSKRFVIQTREPENQLFQNVKRGNLTEFWRQELAERQKFGYPPFKLLIKITHRGPATKNAEVVRMVEEHLAAYEPDIFEASAAPINKLNITHILLRLPPTNWPDRDLNARLQSLPPSFEIDVDPQTIL